MSDEIDKLRAKIAKLMNMTVENGCTEDEQESAMRMAAGLAARAGIALESCRPKGQVAPKAKRKGFTQEFKLHQVLAMQAAAELYGCELYVYAGGKHGCFFVGREENIELSESTGFWLMRQVELLYKQNLPKGLSQRDRAEYRKTFKAACAHRVYHRALDLMRDMRMNEATAQANTGSTALVVQSYFKTLAKENEEYFLGSPEEQEKRKQREIDRRNALTPTEREKEDRETDAAMKRAAKRKGPRGRSMPIGNGTAAGRVAGDSVSLRRQVT